MTQTKVNSAWLTIYRANPTASLRLFCFPYAGGASLIYRQWPDNLPSKVEVCPVQLTGRGSRLREAPYTKVEPLVEALMQVLLPYMDKPFAFFGHSMGAIISFELARRLRRDNAPQPVHLFVSGRRAPQLSETDRITYNLPEPELLDELRRLNGTPREVLENPELMRLMLPLLRADFELVQTYEYRSEPPLEYPISVFGGLQDHEVNRESLEAWREQTNASCTVQMFPGDHFFLNTARPLLLRTLTQKLYQHKHLSAPA